MRRLATARGPLWLLLLSVPATSGCGASSAEMVKVYKSPTCGCCKKWIDHLEAGGLARGIAGGALGRIFLAHRILSHLCAHGSLR